MKHKHLSLEERYYIETALKKGEADSTHKRIPLTKIIASIPVSSLKTS